MSMLPRPPRPRPAAPALRRAALAVCAFAAGAVAACARRPPAAGPHPPSAAADDRCRWEGEPAVLHQAGDTLYRVWTLSARRAGGAWTPADVPALAAFRGEVGARLRAAGVAPDAAALLRRQAAYYAARGDRDSRREAENGRRVLDGAAGAVRAPTCLEALLVDAQARRFPMAGRPTEFHAFVLRRGDGRPVRPGAGGGAPLLVYAAGSGAPWPPPVGRLVPVLAARRREGWRVAAHLHNHPFYLDRLSGPGAGDVAGAVAPSITDVHFYRAMRDALGLEGARVTTGFATLELPAAAFDRLHARGDTAARPAPAR